MSFQFTLILVGCSFFIFILFLIFHFIKQDKIYDLEQEKIKESFDSDMRKLIQNSDNELELFSFELQKNPIKFNANLN